MEIATYTMDELEQCCSDSENTVVERISIGTIRVGNFLFSIPDSILYHHKVDTVEVSINGMKGVAFITDWIKIRKDENEPFHSSPDFVSRNGEEVFIIIVDHAFSVHVYDYGELKHSFEMIGSLPVSRLESVLGVPGAFAI